MLVSGFSLTQGALNDRCTSLFAVEVTLSHLGILLAALGPSGTFRQVAQYIAMLWLGDPQ